MARRRGKKGRSSHTYQNKIDKIKKWYAKLEKNRELYPKTGRKELKPLEEYISKIKKPTEK